MTKIPFNDLGLINNKYKKKIFQKFSECFKYSNFIKGKYNKKLEVQLNKIFNIKHSLLVNSGTDALIVALKILNLKKNDEVITTSNTWISSAFAIALTGAKPVFVDINKHNFQMDTELFKKKINKKTKAIIVTHLYGCPNDMVEIKNICKKNNIKIIEDLAQSHLAKFKNKILGNYGDIAILSFYPSKNLGALGDGGAILTNSKIIYNKCRLYANYGSYFFKDENHKIIGINSRLDEIQAAFLSEKIKDLKKDIKNRNILAKIYDSYCKKINVQPIKIIKYGLSSYHLYPIIIKKKRDLVKKLLLKKNIQTQIHYKRPIHLQSAFKYLNYKKNSLPVTEEISNHILSLPFYTGIKKEKITYLFYHLDKILKKINEKN